LFQNLRINYHKLHQTDTNVFPKTKIVLHPEWIYFLLILVSTTVPTFTDTNLIAKLDLVFLINNIVELVYVLIIT